MTPDGHIIQEFFLEVGDGHKLHIQEWGNPKGLPIIFLHGGPGNHVKDKHKQVFSPDLHRVIFFDQRGCGQSLPYGSLEHNTTQDLIADISKIAKHLSLPPFVLVGGSWGSTLALAYAVTHPGNVRGLVIQGIITGAKAEIDWFEKGGFAPFYPDAWDRYLATVPQKYRHEPSKYHFPRILGDDLLASQSSGHAYETLEGAVYSLDDRFIVSSVENYDPSGIRLEVHYLANHCFLPDRFVMDSAHKLTMPVWLVQGRYDMIAPPAAAYELSQKLPNGHLVLTSANHRTEHEDYNVMRTILIQLAEAQ